jgi:uncharacterized membrane protein
LEKSFAAIILASLFYMLFWDVYAYLKYTNYLSTYFDIGLADYNLYYYSVEHVGALQFFVFMNHLSFITPIIFLFYKLFGNPFSFIWLQNLMLAFTAPIIYFIGSLKEKRLGFAFAISYLANPALWGLGIFDAHLEGIIPFFYMLSLYLYLKRSKLFIASFALLLSIIDTGSVLALFFAIGLLANELIKRGKKDEKMLKVLLASIVLASAFIAAYWALSIEIKSNVPPQLKVMNFFGEQKNVLLKPANNSLGPESLFWLLDVLFSFGISALFSIVPTLFFIAPWLAEVFVVKNALFTTPYMQYFAYAIGGLAGALLGVQNVKARPRAIEASIYFFTALFLFSFLILYPFPLPFARSSVEGIGITLNANSPNYSVMAQGSISPHLYSMLYVENPPDEKPLWFEALNYTTYWFTPNYIILDKNLGDFGPMVSNSFNVYAYMGDNYSIYYSSNGLIIYKRIK